MVKRPTTKYKKNKDGINNYRRKQWEEFIE